MHIVVNRFKLQENANWSALQTQVNDFHRKVSAERAEFKGVSLVRVSDSEAIFLVLFDNLESLNDISRNIAAPLFAEHIRPYLTGPVEPQVGEIIAGHMQ